MADKPTEPRIAGEVKDFIATRLKDGRAVLEFHNPETNVTIWKVRVLTQWLYLLERGDAKVYEIHFDSRYKDGMFAITVDDLIVACFNNGYRVGQKKLQEAFKGLLDKGC